MKETQKISYKYDLMHHNTPKFARTTVQWDTKLMSKITRNRVVKALKSPSVKLGHGDAGKMFRALRDKFEIPELRIYTRADDSKVTYLELTNATPEIRAEANRLLQAEIVMTRLEGNRWWGAEEVKDYTNYLHLYHPHDTTVITKMMQDFMDSDEPKRRIKNALQFIEDGGVVTFTYNPTDR